MKYVTGFAAFWWDFIVGDSIVLALGGVGVLVVGAVLVQMGHPMLAEFVLPVIVAGTLAASLVKG